MPGLSRLSWSRSARNVLALALLLGLSLRCVGDDKSAFEQEFECEEAVAHLQECCKIQISNIECVYVEGSSDCRIMSRTPDLNLETARCLRTASCESITSHGLCTEPKKAICQ